jgi:TonB family protein
MRWRIGLSTLCLTFCILLMNLVFRAAVSGQEPERKVLARTAPVYPELAKRMHLSGKVKLEVVIAPEGKVKSAKLVGGNPVFESNSVNAVMQWRFAAADKATKELILLDFTVP